MKCALCGHTFDPEKLSCHAKCPMGARCTLICCPKCGYQAVDESKSRLADAVMRFWPQGHRGRRRRGHRMRPVPDGVPLTHVPVGMAGEVCFLEHGRAGLSARLSSYGLVPGNRVQVVQRRPVPVLRIDETEIAVSDEIMDRIWVIPVE